MLTESHEPRQVLKVVVIIIVVVAVLLFLIVVFSQKTNEYP